MEDKVNQILENMGYDIESERYYENRQHINYFGNVQKT